MMRREQGVLIAAGLLMVSVLALVTGAAFAQQASSSSYSVDEVFFGNGGELNACSTNYCSKQSAGESAEGNAASTSDQVQGGFNTDRTPYLEVHVTNSGTDLGVLSASSAATATSTFTVKSYLASGYVVRSQSNPPSSGGHTFATPSTPTASAPGTEQFGINLTTNTTACGAPANFGADPVQYPDATFSYGYVTANYSQCGKFMYAKGDVIARSDKSSGQTNYTVSYLFNINPYSPAGQYSFAHDIVVTSTF